MEVKVTQADREAGAELATLAELKDRIRRGEADGSHYVQVCARHRISSQAELIEVPEAIIQKLDAPQSPGHHHSVPGVWDSDNGDKSGVACEWCTTWTKARAAIAKAKGEA